MTHKPILIKTPEQIEGIRRSCALAKQTLDYVSAIIEVGLDTQYINQIAEAFIRDHGAIPAPLNYHGFPKAICTSINEVICHGIPSPNEILSDGDIINVDVTTILDGYYGDTSRMFEIGYPSDEAKKLIAVAKECLQIGIDQVKPGNEFWQIGKAITRHAHQHGFSVVHQFCGHGVGIDFHEEPQINHHFDSKEKDCRTMEPGMVFTIEPMINCGIAEAVIDKADRWTARTKDGRLSAQFEHTLVVTSDGVEILTM